jgi:hypothetical protein
MATHDIVDGFEPDDSETEFDYQNGKRIRFVVTAEIDLNEYDISDGDDPIELLKDQFIKIKSGQYENLACGFVTKVEQLSDNTEETRN